MPDHDIPPPNAFKPNEAALDVFRTRTELVETLNRYRENIRWYVDERNRLIEELDAFKRERDARLQMKQHHERDYPE